MNARGIQGRFWRLYKACNADFESWQSLHALESEEYYGELLTIPNIRDDLLGKQLHGLEALMIALRSTVAQQGSVSRHIARLAADAARQLKAEKLSLAAQKAALGAVPSLLQCVEGLQEISGMLRDEVRLREALLDKISFDSSPDDMRGLLRVFEGQPNVDVAAVQDLLQRVLALEPE